MWPLWREHGWFKLESSLCPGVVGHTCLLRWRYHGKIMTNGLELHTHTHALHVSFRTNFKKKCWTEEATLWRAVLDLDLPQQVQHIYVTGDSPTSLQRSTITVIPVITGCETWNIQESVFNGKQTAWAVRHREGAETKPKSNKLTSEGAGSSC